MEFPITVSSSTSDLFDEKEDNDLSLLNINWSSELNIKISNPYIIDASKIKIIETPSTNF
jgi:hypothetical protein